MFAPMLMATAGGQSYSKSPKCFCHSTYFSKRENPNRRRCPSVPENRMCLCRVPKVNLKLEASLYGRKYIPQAQEQNIWHPTLSMVSVTCHGKTVQDPPGSGILMCCLRHRSIEDTVESYRLFCLQRGLLTLRRSLCFRECSEPSALFSKMVWRAWS